MIIECHDRADAFALSRGLDETLLRMTPERAPSFVVNAIIGASDLAFAVVVAPFPERGDLFDDD